MENLNLGENFSLIFTGSLVVLLAAQVYLLYKIRGLIKRMGRSLEGIAYILRKHFHTSRPQNSDPFSGIPRNCQFCKHRLAFIHADGEENRIESLRYRCNISKQPVAPNATCSRFELDTTLFE